MIKRFCLFAVLAMVSTLLFVRVAAAQQFPILDAVAEKVVQKYQHSTCEQLWQQKNQPKTEMEQQIVKTLHGDPQMRAEFFRKVAVPIAEKMFECGMIP